MSSTGPTKIIRGGIRPTELGDPQPSLPPAGQGRLQQVAAALAAEAQAAGALPGRATRLSVDQAADVTSLSARRAALAAALQEWSGPTSGTLRTTALAVLAASRTARLRQEATTAREHPAEETVFEAFFRGVEGRPTAQLQTGRAGQR